MPIELSILTFIILIILPFVFLVISLKPTLEGYEYVKISMMVLTSIIFFIAAYAFISTGGIAVSLTGDPLERRDLYSPGGVSLTNDVEIIEGQTSYHLCFQYTKPFGIPAVYYPLISGCADPKYNFNFQGHAGANERIVLFAVDGMYNNTISKEVTNIVVDKAYANHGIAKSSIPLYDDHIYYYQESNPIVGSSFDMQILSSIYMMIGLISTVFAIGEVFRIPMRKI